MNNKLIKTFPYMTWFITKSKYKNGCYKIIDDIPDNYIDYIIVDAIAGRLNELNTFVDTDILGHKSYKLNIVILNDENFEFPISEYIYTKITNKLTDILGEPERVHYNLNTARKFKVIRGGKLNGK